MKMFTAEEPLNVQREFSKDVKQIGEEIRKRLVDKTLLSTLY